MSTNDNEDAKTNTQYRLNMSELGWRPVPLVLADPAGSGKKKAVSASLISAPTQSAGAGDRAYRINVPVRASLATLPDLPYADEEQKRVALRRLIEIRCLVGNDDSKQTHEGVLVGKVFGRTTVVNNSDAPTTSGDVIEGYIPKPSELRKGKGSAEDAKTGERPILWFRSVNPETRNIYSFEAMKLSIARIENKMQSDRRWGLSGAELEDRLDNAYLTQIHGIGLMAPVEAVADVRDDLEKIATRQNLAPLTMFDGLVNNQTLFSYITSTDARRKTWAALKPATQNAIMFARAGRVWDAQIHAGERYFGCADCRDFELRFGRNVHALRELLIDQDKMIVGKAHTSALPGEEYTLIFGPFTR
jgi:hypothetical protein